MTEPNKTTGAPAPTGASPAETDSAIVAVVTISENAIYEVPLTAKEITEIAAQADSGQTWKDVLHEDDTVRSNYLDDDYFKWCTHEVTEIEHSIPSPSVQVFVASCSCRVAAVGEWLILANGRARLADRREGETVPKGIIRHTTADRADVYTTRGPDALCPNCHQPARTLEVRLHDVAGCSHCGRAASGEHRTPDGASICDYCRQLERLRRRVADGDPAAGKAGQCPGCGGNRYTDPDSPFTESSTMCTKCGGRFP